MTTRNQPSASPARLPFEDTTLVPIRHASTAWAVAAMIEPAPGAMMIRELVKNALEAAEQGNTQLKKSWDATTSV